jgi:hypothetical protein
MNALPEHRKALSGRTSSRTWYPEDFDPIEAYRGGGGLAWRIAQYAFVVALFGGLGVAAFLYLAR